MLDGLTDGLADCLGDELLLDCLITLALWLFVWLFDLIGELAAPLEGRDDVDGRDFVVSIVDEEDDGREFNANRLLGSLLD